MVGPGHPRRTTMDHDKLDRLLNDYARHQPEDRVLSDEERVQLQAELAEEPAEEESGAREVWAPARTRTMPWILGSGALAAAAIITIVLFLPEQASLELGITVVTSERAADRTRGESRFEVDVSANGVVHAHLVVLDESGGFSVLPGAAKRIERTGTVGSFRIYPKGEALRRTQAIIVASRDSIAVEALAKALPDRLPPSREGSPDAQLIQLCADLAEGFGWVADFKPIPAPSE